MEVDEETGLYDVKRLAKKLGVQPSTIRSMKARGTLPKPTSNDINGGAVWKQSIIESFLEQKKPIYDFKELVDPGLPKIVDLFSGCGGMTLGFSKVGFEVVAGYDNWDDAVKTYNANIEHDSYLLDLSDFERTTSVLSKHFIKEKPIIIGGPPCQDFSSAGKRNEGIRADLTERFAEIVVYFSPSCFVMENVSRSIKSIAFDRAKKIFYSGGYYVDQLILDASYCGVPQRRKRLFTIGSKEKILVENVSRLLIQNLSNKEMSLRDYFGSSLKTDYYYRHPRSYARRAIFSIDEPSPTIRGVNRPIPDGYPGHPGDAAQIESARPLTTEERAQIQTFPKNYNFIGSKTSKEQMIGNAVPVRMAEYVATQLAKSFLG